MSSDSILATDLDIKPDTVYAYISFFLSLITCWILTLIIISSVTFACYSFHRVESKYFVRQQFCNALMHPLQMLFGICGHVQWNGLMEKKTPNVSDTKCSFPKFFKATNWLQITAALQKRVCTCTVGVGNNFLRICKTMYTNWWHSWASRLLRTAEHKQSYTTLCWPLWSFLMYHYWFILRKMCCTYAMGVHRDSTCSILSWKHTQ